MKKINFLFGIHNHQPVGNFDFVFEEAYQKSYRPFIEVLRRHPKIRIAIHFSGILLDWIKKHHPDYMPMLRNMVEQGQLEILTGGFYEPILAVIPKADRLGQIKKLTSAVKETFGYEARGMWLAERIWEPTLPSTLDEAGVEYTILDDTHFKYAGLRDEDLNGYYLTEDLCNTVRLFPISKRLRYTIPFEEPQATIDHLRGLASEDGRFIVVFADDGEKFGVWPNTYDHVYTNGWLDRFFSVLEENLDWINIMHFSEAVDRIKPLGRIYLPTASYAEMGEWSLFSRAQQQFVEFEHYLQEQGVSEQNNVFVRGGFWRNFLAKYREVNDMHKKMIYVSKQIWQKPETERKKLHTAMDHVWAAQCNCPYWHGVFGGIYLSHIRDAIYRHLIEAEKELDHLDGVGRKLPRIIVKDINVDGYDEVILESDVLNAYFDLKAGGMLYELDYKPLAKNILDTMTRRHEAYHNQLDRAVTADQQNGETASIHDLVLAKEPDLKSKLHYDFYDRKALIDHFLHPDTNIRDFSAAHYKEEGNFVNSVYRLEDKEETRSGLKIILQRDGHISGQPVRLRKQIAMKKSDGRMTIDYEIINRSNVEIDTVFGVEFNFGLQAGHADDRYYYLQEGKPDDPYLDSTGILENRNFIGLRDDWRGLDISLKSDQSGSIWRFPIETISLSEGGFERVYQSSAVLFNWPLRLKDVWKVKMEMKLGICD
ncbi:MAG TPA: DUF1926 domain-containing protein [Caldithrix abyssi]|uniref:DUF1926 domain-containing protein n=1 Tax=Caldithrix abyssi TaxID=187145 RepID=A0A7V4WX32_CALAY|nr:DUF1926 domain-containing protein [Caldithrix abyssi]